MVPVTCVAHDPEPSGADEDAGTGDTKSRSVAALATGVLAGSRVRSAALWCGGARSDCLFSLAGMRVGGFRERERVGGTQARAAEVAGLAR